MHPPQQAHSCSASGAILDAVTFYRYQLMLGFEDVLTRDDGEVRIQPTDGSWRVSRIRLGVLSTYGDAAGEDHLDRLLESALGATLDRPRRGRLVAGAPASNYRTIASLIGSSELQAVFDTYLDNQSLEQLIHIVSFGKGTFAAQARLLGTTATTQAMSVDRPGLLKPVSMRGQPSFVSKQRRASSQTTLNIGGSSC